MDIPPWQLLPADIIHFGSFRLEVIASSGGSEAGKNEILHPMGPLIFRVDVILSILVVVIDVRRTHHYSPTITIAITGV